MRDRIVRVLAFVALLGASFPASAQPKAPPPASSSSAAKSPPADPSAEARKRFMDGVAFAKKNEWPYAYAAFVDAWKLKEHPQIALNLGRAELETGRYREAIAHLRYCIEHDPPNHPDVALARDWLVEAEKKAFRLDITVDVAGAMVTVDEREVGESPLAAPVLVDPGSHVVEASFEGRHARRGVVGAGGTSMTVRLSFGPPSSEPAATSAPEPAATSAPEPAAMSAPESASLSTRHKLLIGGAAGTFVGLAIGTWLGIASVVQADKRDECLAREDAPCWTKLEEQRLLLARASTVGFAIGAALAAGTGAYYLFGPRETGPRVVVAPVLSTAGGGIAVSGRW